MKKLFLTSSLALFFAANISAQQESGYEYDDVYDPRPTRESYITNKWFDNIFVGVGIGGGTTFGKEITESLFSPEFNVSILKWFSPTIGFRAEFMQLYQKEGLVGYTPYQFASGHSVFPFELNSTGAYGVGYEPGTLYYGHSNFNFAVLWNLTQFFGYYNPQRFYNLSIYAQGGYSHLYDNKSENKGWKTNYDREISLAAGLYNTFKIADRWNIFADIAIMGYSGDYRTDRGYSTILPNISVGVSYNIYKTKWNNKKKFVERITDAEAQTVEVKQENKALEQAIEEKADTIGNLADELDKLKKQLDQANSEIEILKSRSFEYMIFFDLDIDKMSKAEAKRTKIYVKEVLAMDPDHTFYITGSADKGTGSLEHNVDLSTRRALGVQKFLIDEMGIKEDHIVIRESLVTDSQMGANFDRRVFFESK